MLGKFCSIFFYSTKRVKEKDAHEAQTRVLMMLRGRRERENYEMLPVNKGGGVMIFKTY